MLPLMPPLALLVAGLLSYWQNMMRPGQPELRDNSPDSWLMRTWGALLLLLLLALPVAMVLTGFPGFGWGSLRFGLMLLLAVGLGAGLVWQGIARRRVNFLIGTTLLMVAGILVLVMPAYPLWEGRRDVPGQRQLRQVGQAPALRAVQRWYSLDTMHVKQVWAAGRAVPIWHPSVAQLASLSQPVVVLSAQPARQKLPAGWAGYLRISRQDSFYLDRGSKSGVWYIARLDAVR